MKKYILITLSVITLVVFSCKSLKCKKSQTVKVNIEREGVSNIETNTVNQSTDTIFFIKKDTISTSFENDFDHFQFEEFKLSYIYDHSIEKDFLYIDIDKGDFEKYELPFRFEMANFEILNFQNSKEYVFIMSDIDFYGTVNNFLFYKDGKLYYLGSFFIDEGDREYFENYIPVYFEVLKIENIVLIKTYKNGKLLHTKTFQIKNELLRIY